MKKIIDFKATKCKHCYKCVRNCDVKAIMIKDGKAEIIPELCVLCGHCLQVCPQSAKTLISDLDMVKYMVSRGEKVIVSIAPSYMGLLKHHSIGQINTALRKLGFTDVRETSEGAAVVTAEYDRLLAWKILLPPAVPVLMIWLRFITLNLCPCWHPWYRRWWRTG